MCGYLFSYHSYDYHRQIKSKNDELQKTTTISKSFWTMFFTKGGTNIYIFLFIYVLFSIGIEETTECKWSTTATAGIDFIKETTFDLQCFFFYIQNGNTRSLSCPLVFFSLNKYSSERFFSFPIRVRVDILLMINPYGSINLLKSKIGKQQIIHRVCTSVFSDDVIFFLFSLRFPSHTHVLIRYYRTGRKKNEGNKLL